MKRVCSIFSQILQVVPRDRFEAAVGKHKAERHSRGFSSWGQFVAMLFCQLAQAKSLREITEGLQASEGKLKHLGLPEAPARSTLAYANSHRPWELYETVFHQLLADCRSRLGVAKAGSKLGLPGKLLSLDATVIDLCAEVFDWAHSIVLIWPSIREFSFRPCIAESLMAAVAYLSRTPQSVRGKILRSRLLGGGFKLPEASKELTPSPRDFQGYERVSH